MKRVEVGGDLGRQRCREGDTLPRTLPFITVPLDLARPGVQGRQAVQGTRPLRLVLVPVGQGRRLGGPGRGRGGRAVFSSMDHTTASGLPGRVSRSSRADTVAEQAASHGGGEESQPCGRQGCG